MSPTSSNAPTKTAKPIIPPEMAKKHHDEWVKEFSVVFANKVSALKDQNQLKDISYHWIQLKDLHKSINERMFAFAEQYMNWMIEFIEYHLLAGYIWPSKSPILASTWMVSQNGRTDVMPHVMHDYRALNENRIKDHILLPHQDQILHWITKARLYGYIDLPDVYYQMSDDV